MTYAPGCRIGEDICKLLGIDHKNVYRLVIDIKADAVPTIEVCRFLETSEVASMEGGFRNLRNVAKVKEVGVEMSREGEVWTNAESVDLCRNFQSKSSGTSVSDVPKQLRRGPEFL